ncbi:MAG: hypothetical protein LBB24_00550 [Rickettsiales bacterium]|jgi:hypothetical protein|nr:hypothetical protein [Rickettsiales bacterium]
MGPIKTELDTDEARHFTEMVPKLAWRKKELPTLVEQIEGIAEYVISDGEIANSSLIREQLKNMAEAVAIGDRTIEECQNVLESIGEQLDRDSLKGISQETRVMRALKVIGDMSSVMDGISAINGQPGLPNSALGKGVGDVGPNNKF